MTTNHKPGFTVIKGGLSEDASGRKIFQSAYVTDTRLMGVIGVYVHWKLPDNFTQTDFHQFFYFDAEEYGFDTYKSILTGPDGDGLEDLKDIENALIGGLGGKHINLSEAEVRYLVQDYTEFNRRLNMELPDSYDEYRFLLRPRIELSRTEEYVLMSKQCPILNSPYMVINYFLMRCFGKDFGAAKFLTKNYVRTNIFPEHKMATLFRNAIDPAPDSESGANTGYYATDGDKDFGTFHTHKSYLCESLIEYDKEFFIIVTQVTLDNLRVVKFEKISSFKISSREAMMMLSRPEYVTVYDLVPEAPQFHRNTTQLSSRAMINYHDTGELYMIFYPHNNHVDRQTYLLNNDVLGNYFVSASNQLVISSYTKEGILELERDFIGSEMARYASLAAKYQFEIPVLDEFVHSPFDDFVDFAMAITKDSYPDED